MSSTTFWGSIIIIIILLLFVWLTPSRHFPRGYNVKKIKLKYFGFLFNEGLSADFKKSKEISLKVFLFQLIGYIINILLLISVVILYFLNINIPNYVIIAGGLAELVICFIFAACNDSY